MHARGDGLHQYLDAAIEEYCCVCLNDSFNESPHAEMGTNVKKKGRAEPALRFALHRFHEANHGNVSNYGVVGGCLAGHQWRTRSYDATNVIYASVWEFWKGEEHWAKFPTCRCITHWNAAGNIIEALLGAAWIHPHYQQGQDLDALQLSDAHKDSAGYHGSLFASVQNCPCLRM